MILNILDCSTVLQYFIVTLSMRLSPTSARLMSSPLELQMRMEQVGGGPVLAIVPAVVSIDTLKPCSIVCTPVL